MKRNSASISLAKHAYTEIRNSILSGELPLGSPISRRNLARELGMSVVPVSDALQRLETEGLVESWPRVGTRVKIPSASDIRGHYVVREALESQSARLFSLKATPDERLEIVNLARTLDDRYRQSAAGELAQAELFQLHQLHLHFHMRVAECGGHPALCRAIESNQILTFNWLYDTAAHRTDLPADHHTRLANSLCRGIPEEADAAMREHVMYGREDLLRALQAVLSGNNDLYAGIKLSAGGA